MRSVWYRLRSILLRRRVDREMREEMSQHLERATERLVARGLSPDAARKAALREFGNVHYLQEEARDVRGARWFDALTPDAKLALRMLVKNPLMSVVGGLGMAVAIAIATGFFIFMTYYYSDAPVEEGDRVVTVAYLEGDDDRSTLFDYQLWKAELESLVDLAAYSPHRRTLESPVSGSLPARGVEMTASGFRVARVPPLLGRPLLDSDEIEGALPVVVIGYREWQEGFGGDPDIVGSEARLGGTPHTIVGVMPEGFRLPANHGFWTSMETRVATDAEADGPRLKVFGRLAPGIEMAAAEAEVAIIGAALSARYPEIYQRYRAAVRPYIRHLMDVQQYPAWVVWLMQLFAALILTVVAVNVAVLVYARTAIRRAEITVRTALGASRSRIVTQLFLEALALSAAAAVLGLLIAQVGFRQLTSAIDSQADIPYWLFGNLPASTILYAAGLALLAAFLVGVLPALQATGRNLQGTLRELGGGTGLQLGRTWTLLICLQVAVAMGVLPAIVGVAWNYTPPPIPTFPASDVLTFRLHRTADLSGSGTERPEVSDSTYGVLQAELLSRVEAIPGVTDVAFAANLPLRGRPLRIELESAGGTAELPTIQAVSHWVGSGYFHALGVPFLAGARFDGDDAGPMGTAAIVSRSFVEVFFGNGDALGRRFREVYPGAEDDEAARWYEIVGVVEDMLIPARGRRPTPATYHPIGLETEFLSLIARTRSTEMASIAPRVQEIARGLAPNFEFRLFPMDALYRADRGELGFLLMMVGLITTSVLLLSAGGISAMMSFAVTRRRREIGIRTALGASRGQLARSIFARSSRQLCTGLLIGGAAAALLDRVTAGAMLGEQATPLLAFVVMIMLLSGLLATFGPVRRAWRTHPMEALREE